MAKGRSLRGFLASSPAVEAASNPMKEKNTWPAAAVTPRTPRGRKGVRLVPSKEANATMQKKTKMATFKITMVAFTHADSETPRKSSAAHASTTTTAGTLISPPSPGGLANCSGMEAPKELRNALRYSPHPTATAATDTPYSSMSIQPTAQATISPRVT